MCEHGQNMNNEKRSYDISKKKSRGNMKRKKDADQYKIVREYKNMLSCNELIERIIIYHMDERNIVGTTI